MGGPGKKSEQIRNQRTQDGDLLRMTTQYFSSHSYQVIHPSSRLQSSCRCHYTEDDQHDFQRRIRRLHPEPEDQD